MTDKQFKIICYFLYIIYEACKKDLKFTNFKLVFKDAEDAISDM